MRFGTFCSASYWPRSSALSAFWPGLRGAVGTKGSPNIGTPNAVQFPNYNGSTSQASGALENARLYERTKAMAEDLRQALEKERWLSIEKQKIGAYIPKQLMDDISRNREQKLALGGKTVWATILFSDIVGFTRLAETMESQQVVSFLNVYMTAMTHIIEAEGGLIDKFIGDGIMAIFTPLSEADNHALWAMRAGIRM